MSDSAGSAPVLNFGRTLARSTLRESMKIFSENFEDFKYVVYHTRSSFRLFTLETILILEAYPLFLDDKMIVRDGLCW